MSSAERFEIKYKFLSSDAAYAYRWLGCQPGVQSEHPPRIVNSIYFDTALFDIAKQSVNGVSDRCKPRLRWYCSNTHDINSSLNPEVMLELKIKRGACGYKRRTRAGYLTSAGRVDAMAMLTSGINQESCIPELMPIIRQNLFPVLAVRYLRHYFHDHRGIRVTFDTMLDFARPNQEIIHPDTYVPAIPMTIMEVKFLPNTIGAAAKILHTLQASPVKFSKYLEGLSSMEIFRPV